MYELSQHYPWLMPGLLLIPVVALGFAWIFNHCAKKAEEAHAAKIAAEALAKEQEPPKPAPIVVLDPELAPGFRQSQADAYVRAFLADPDQELVIDLKPIMGEDVHDLVEFIALSEKYQPVVKYIEAALLEAGYNYRHTVDFDSVFGKEFDQVGVVWAGATGPSTEKAGRKRELVANNIVRRELGSLFSDKELIEFYSESTCARSQRLVLAEGRVAELHVTASIKPNIVRFVGSKLVIDQQKTYAFSELFLRKTYDGIIILSPVPGGYTVEVKNLYEGKRTIALDYYFPVVDGKSFYLFKDQRIATIKTVAESMIAVPMLTPALLQEIESLGKSASLVVYRSHHFLNIEVHQGRKTILISDQSAYFYRTDDFDDVVKHDTLVSELMAVYGHDTAGGRMELKTEDNDVVWHFSPKFEPAETPATEAA